MSKYIFVYNKKGEIHMSSKKFDIKLFFILIFLGWFGIDKLVYKNYKMFAIKFVLFFFVLGIFWNIYDIVMCCFKRYEVNPF